jgi:hypothetical protein
MMASTAFSSRPRRACQSPPGCIMTKEATKAHPGAGAPAVGATEPIYLPARLDEILKACEREMEPRRKAAERDKRMGCLAVG